jgi:hypothetical protein
MEYSRLSLADSVRSVESELATKKHRRRFLDFVVNGRSPLSDFNAGGLDLITPLWVDEPIAAVESLSRLLGDVEGDAPHGRVAVYVCAECGDLGCGAITAKLVISDAAVEWTDWGYQTNYSDDIDRETAGGAADLAFDRAKYERLLRGAIERFDPR